MDNSSNVFTEAEHRTYWPMARAANADLLISEGRVRDSLGTLIEPQPDVDVDDLYIHDARIDDGPRLKRWKPRARGAAYPYKKYYSHISIRLRPRGRS